MTFQHSLYNGTNAGGGKATTEIQVVVKNSKDESLYDSGKIAGTASIDKTKIIELAAQPDLTVTVTLTQQQRTFIISKVTILLKTQQ